MTIDLFPTFAKLVGAQLPAHKIDGLDVWSVISGKPGATNPHSAYFFFYNQGELHAVRSGQWKLMLPHTSRTLGDQPKAHGGQPAKYQPFEVGLELYDIAHDPGETSDVATRNPDIVRRLQAYAEEARADLGDALTHRAGSWVREPGRVP
jgi:arylsulfatase